MTEPSELVVVRAYSQPHEAHLACSALHAAGLHATVIDANIVAAVWLFSNAVGGVKLLVREADASAAREVLDGPAVVDQDDDADFRAAVDASPVVRCPRCGSERVVRQALGRRMAALSWLLTGVPLFPVWRKQRCEACGLLFAR
jgi:hypothetical protein